MKERLAYYVLNKDVRLEEYEELPDGNVQFTLFWQPSGQKTKHVEPYGVFQDIKLSDDAVRRARAELQKAGSL